MRLCSHFLILPLTGNAHDNGQSEAQAEYSAEEPTAQPKFELSYEPISVKNLNAALSRSAVLLVSDPNFNMYECARCLQLRAIDVKDGVGKIPVIRRRTRGLGSLDGRYITGCGDIPVEQLPRVIRIELEKGVPRELAGRSTFDMPRGIRHLSRAGLGMAECDICASIFGMICHILGPDTPQTILRMQSEYKQLRADLHEALLKSNSSVTLDIAKEFFTAMTFGRSVYATLDGLSCEIDGAIAEYVYELETGLRLARALIAKRFADEYALVKAKLNAMGCLLFHVYAHFEMQAMTKMKTAAESAQYPVPSLEHDGVGFEHKGTPEEARVIMQSAVDDMGLKVSIKSIPEDPFETLAAQYPHLDWTTSHEIDHSTLQKFRKQCLDLIALNDSARIRANDDVFASWIAHILMPVCYLPFAEGDKRTHYELFTGKGLWKTFHMDDGYELVMQQLKTLAWPLHRGYWHRRADEALAPEPLNCTAFAKKLSSAVMSKIANLGGVDRFKDLDGDQSRHKLLFSDGLLYDFATNSTRRSTPTDRMGHTCARPFSMWQPAAHVQDLADQTFDRIQQFLKDDGIEFADNEVGQSILENLDVLATHCELLFVVRSFMGDWDSAVWLLRQFARAIVGERRFTEFMYIWGAGDSGKDQIMNIFFQFLGEADHNYGCLLAGSYVIKDGLHNSKDAATPFLAATRGKRLVWCSEVPYHNALQVDVLKAYAEQTGAPITARKLFRNQTSFRPIGLLACTSNSAPQVSPAEMGDSGLQRRLLIWETTGVYKHNPAENTTDKRADPNLPPKITSGFQILYVVSKLFATFKVDVNKNPTRIVPMPAAILRNLGDFAEDSPANQLRAILADPTKCEVVERKFATKMTDFKKKIYVTINVPKPINVGPVLTELGIDAQGVPNELGHRVVVNVEGKGVKLLVQ